MRLRPRAAHRPIEVFGVLRSGGPCCAHQAEPLCLRRRLDPAADLELAEDARDVDARRLPRDEERLADLTVSVPLGKELEHIELAVGEAEAILGPGRSLPLVPRRHRAPRQRETRPAGERLDLTEERRGAALPHAVRRAYEQLAGLVAALAGEQEGLRRAPLGVGTLERLVEIGPALGRPAPQTRLGAASKPRGLRLDHGA